jgi:ATP-dependent Clp protease ATP-binding subunit ClpC
VLLALLPLLDEGHLTDARGRKVSFRNTVIVLTSNLGVATANENKPRLGFGASAPSDNRDDQERDQALQRARAAMPPELWNRIDEPLWFRALDRKAVASIAQSFVDRLGVIVEKEHGIEVIATQRAIDRLVILGHDATLGARPMKRAVGRLIEAPLAKLILGGEAIRGTQLIVDERDEEIVLRVAESVDSELFVAAE